MKSNSEPASMRTPNKVEKAPSSTGANMCSSASTARLWRSPMAVRNAYNTHTRTKNLIHVSSSSRGLQASKSNLSSKIKRRLFPTER